MMKKITSIFVIIIFILTMSGIAMAMPPGPPPGCGGNFHPYYPPRPEYHDHDNNNGLYIAAGAMILGSLLVNAFNKPQQVQPTVVVQQPTPVIVQNNIPYTTITQYPATVNKVISEETTTSNYSDGTRRVETTTIYKNYNCTQKHVVTTYYYSKGTISTTERLTNIY